MKKQTFLALLICLSLTVFCCSCSKAAKDNSPAVKETVQEVTPEKAPVKSEKKVKETVEVTKNLADYTNYKPGPNEVVYIIDPDNGPGTDYTSLNEFNDREKRNLVLRKEIVVALCRSSKGTPDKAAQIEGFVTSDEYYVKIIADEGHRADAKWDEKKYRIEEYTTINSECLDVEVEHLVVDGIQMRIYGTGKSNDIIDPEKGKKYVIKNCYLWMELDVQSGYGIDLKSRADIYNCIFRGTGSAAVFAFPGAEVHLYNNTFIGWKNAIKNEGLVKAVNNISIGTSQKAYRDKDDGLFTDDSDYNSAEFPGQALVRAPRNNQQPPWHLNNKTQNEIFVDPENNDFNLKPGTLFHNIGIGPDAFQGVPETDINGKSRDGAVVTLGAAERS